MAAAEIARRGGEVSVALRWCALEEVDAGTRQAWTQLALAAAEPDMFAMPQFVMPAARWLTPGRPPQVALFERVAHGRRELIGVGCFTHERANLFVPMAHLRAYRCEHTYRTGLLCVPGEEQAVAEALMRPPTRGARWRAIAFHDIGDAAAFDALHAQARRQGGGWSELRRFERPVLRLRAGQSAAMQVRPAVAKDLRRRHRRLQEQGELEVAIVTAADGIDAAIDHHLRLEHMGWKKDAGTSLLGDDRQAAFFREMARAFAGIGAAAFVELRLDGEVVASTSNFVVGGTFSAFKTGWDPRLAACSPGKLAEWLLFGVLGSRWPGLHKFDSNAAAGSYLAGMLPHGDTLLSGCLTLDRRATRTMRWARPLRSLAYRIGREP